MAATGAFFVMDPITPLIIEEVPQIPLNRWGSLALLGWWTRSMTASGRRTQSPCPLPELLLELSDELVLLLDNEVLGPDIAQERVFVVVGIGLVMGLRYGPCRLLT